MSQPRHTGDVSSVSCAACRSEIPGREGRFRVGDQSYHVDCYKQLKPADTGGLEARETAGPLPSGSSERNRGEGTT